MLSGSRKGVTPCAPTVKNSIGDNTRAFVRLKNLEYVGFSCSHIVVHLKMPMFLASRSKEDPPIAIA